MLHPSYKKAYFEKAGWLPEWIDVAEELVRTQFNKKYANIPLDTDSNGGDSDRDNEDEGGHVNARATRASGDKVSVVLRVSALHVK